MDIEANQATHCVSGSSSVPLERNSPSIAFTTQARSDLKFLQEPVDTPTGYYRALIVRHLQMNLLEESRLLQASGSQGGLEEFDFRPQVTIDYQHLGKEFSQSFDQWP